MKKIDIKSIVKIAILLVNIAFITIPYTFGNARLEKQLKNIKKIEKSSENSQDFYKIYEDFNKVLGEMNISPVSKKMSMEGENMYITLRLDKDKNSIINLLTYLNKKLPTLSVISADISANADKISEIVFFIGDNHD